MTVFQSFRKGETILHYAALSGNKEMVKVLIDLGCNRYIRDSDGKLAVDLAKKLDKRDIVELLTGTLILNPFFKKFIHFFYSKRF